MTDPNRERWEQEAEEYVRRDLACCSIEFKGAASVGYLAACEKYALRWVVEHTEEYWTLWDAGWRGFDEDGNHRCMVPPAPPRPGGEE